MAIKASSVPTATPRRIKIFAHGRQSFAGHVRHRLGGVWARQWIRGRERLLLAERDRHGIVIPPAAMAVRSVSNSGLVFVETSKIEADDISPTNVGAVHVSTKTSR
jgi:hypothetical protein